MHIDHNEPGVRINTLIQTGCSWDGAELPAYPTEKPQITILRYTVEPNQRLSHHHHVIINCGIVVEGEITVVALDGKEHTFKKGEPIVEMVGPVHYGENRGQVTTELIMFYAGAEGLPLSVKDK